MNLTTSTGVPPLSKEQLKAKLRERGLKVCGSKADLQKRLNEHENNGTCSSLPYIDNAIDDSGSLQDQDDNSATGDVPSAELAILTKGNALATLMPVKGPLFTATHLCLELLSGSEKSPSDEDQYVDQETDDKLQPLVHLVTALTQSATVHQAETSYAANVRDVTNGVRAAFEGTDFDGIEPEVLAVLKAFIPDLATSGKEACGPGGDDELTMLGRECNTVKRAIEVYLRRGMSSFPSPTVGVWPQDFEALESSQIRSFIGAYVDDTARSLLVEDVKE